MKGNTYACMHVQKHGNIRAQPYTLTHVSASVLQDHAASTVTCRVNTSEGVY